MNNIIAEMGPIVRCHGALMRLSCENNKPHDLNASLSSFDYAEIMMECRPGCPATKIPTILTTIPTIETSIPTIQTITLLTNSEMMCSACHPSQVHCPKENFALKIKRMLHRKQLARFLCIGVWLYKTFPCVFIGVGVRIHWNLSVDTVFYIYWIHCCTLFVHWTWGMFRVRN